MYKKHIIIYFTILSTLLTALFSNIYAETTSVAETVSETTTEAPSVINNYADSSKTLDISARAAVLIDADTGVVIYEKNPHEKLYPASITKIMTAYLACQYGKFDDTLTASHNAVFGIGPGSSIIGIDEGEQISFLDGLYGIMMESANEVCMMVAEHIDGTVEKFVERMNKQAQEWGCKDTHFNNPHGFHDENHYTTAYDMGIITYNAIKNKDFAKIWGTVDHTIPATNKNVARNLHNKDKMLKPTSDYYYEYAIGGKTGFHDEAKNTLVTCAEKDGVKLISVVMKDSGYEKTYEDSKKILDYGFSVYKENTVYTNGSYTDEISVYQDYQGESYNVGTLDVTVAKDVKAKLPSFISPDKITTKAEIKVSKDGKNENILTAPINAGDKVGTLNFVYDNKTISTADITAVNSVEKKTDKQLASMKFFKAFKSVMWTILKAIIILIPVVLIIAVVLALRNGFNKKKNRRRKKKSGSKSSGRKRTPSKNGKSSSSNKATSKKGSSTIPRRPKTSEELRMERREKQVRRAIEESKYRRSKNELSEKRALKSRPQKK